MVYESMKQTTSFIFDSLSERPEDQCGMYAFRRQTHVLETAHRVPTRVQMELLAKTDDHKEGTTPLLLLPRRVSGNLKPYWCWGTS